MGKIPLFNESDQEAEEPVEFRTNKGYAKHYDEFRRKEVLGQLKNLESDAESTSSDDETTDEEVVDAEFDREFFRTLAYLKRQDETKYEEKVTFFGNVKPVEEVALEKRKKKEKPMTLKDYERKVILEKGGIYEDEEPAGQPPRAESPSLVQQQEQLKDEIKRALSKIDTDDEEDDLLKERSKSQKEVEREQADYLKWLADRKNEEAPSEDVKPLEPLKNFWSSKNLSKEDAFLKDYILNKRFVDNSGEVPTYEEIVATSEDEEELEKQEEYERKFNFRFEEPDSEFIKRYPRNVEESVRIEKNKRKEQRQALKERKQQEKEQKKRDLEELKAIKLQEIKEKIEKLKAIAASEKMALKEEDLEADFDPDEHDRRMQQMFDDDYYGVDEGDQKPEFPDLDEELGIENYDREKVDDSDENGPHCEDDDFNMDADYEDNVAAAASSSKKDLRAELLEATAGKKKKGKKMSKFVEMLRSEKPLFDPEDEKTYGEYIDEYYKLDYEDLIGGDTPCRFRYVETVPNDFGLSVGEILAANTRELNRWASVKKTVQIRPKYAELGEVEAYKRKAQNDALKKKILPSLYAQQEESEEDEEIKQNKVTKFEDEETSEVKETKDKKKKKKKKKSNTVTETVTVESNVKVETNNEESTQTSKKKKKEKSANSDAVNGEEAVETPKKKKKDKSNSTAIQETTSEVQETDKKDDARAEDNRKSKKRKLQDTETVEKEPTDTPKQDKKKKKFNKNRDRNGHEGPASNVTDSRLRAFGINPRKFHNKLKYGGGSGNKDNTDEGRKGPQNGGGQHKSHGKFNKQKGKFGNKNFGRKNN